jgi:hypothetical protein
MEGHLQWLRVWLMTIHEKRNPSSLRTAAWIRPSMMFLAILRAACTQSHKIDMLG